ncbi:hypothetical protein [Aeromicrobium erythreum]|uniref:Htaa domain-containing protein n=1 Tax=Aeromicrobium erythreum TaxID=2041 RepID=A0A0U3SZZ5_9ACTN|nr:hypothetical protein [Aeromicrobium erythreum]ALX04072.1 hypothetical protein AERYTH_04850 [Aeromicrobium erythreum]
MLRPWRDLAAVGLVLGLALLPSAALAEQPGTADPAAAQESSGPRAVDDAVLRWGLNDESNNRAFAPGTINFLSAGKVPDPGRGGTIMPASGWSARTGDVAVEKWDGSAYRPATWAGLRTDATGAAIGGGRFSGHQLVFSGGEGTIDAAAGDATIRWDGDASVVYYSGMAFFYLSDPELTVDDGVGQVTAELGGFASSMEDLTAWGPVAPQRVIVADLGPVDLGSAQEEAGGFTATPAYDGVQVTGVPQVRPYGSFPQSFIDFQRTTGTAAYWYSSGGSADPYKKASPMTVSWAGADVTPPPTPGPAPLDPIENPVVQPPRPSAATPTTSSAGRQTRTAAPGTPAANLAPPAGAAVRGELVQTRPVSTLLPPPAAASERSGDALWWWLAAALTGIAALVVAGSSVAASRTSRPSPDTAPRRG